MRKLTILIPFLLSTCFFILAEEPQIALQKIKERNKIILQAAVAYQIDTNLLKAVIYTERTLNYNWLDKALDVPVALKGYNNSIGFCQVKMKTAYWIERQLADSTSQFFPGQSYFAKLPVSQSPRQIIARLLKDSLNIHYAAAYIRIILSYWQKAGHPISEKPDIIGTLYSTGLFMPDGKIRKPNNRPSANFFGRKVLKAYKIIFSE